MPLNDSHIATYLYKRIKNVPKIPGEPMYKLTNLTWRYLDDRHQSEGGDILQTFNFVIIQIIFKVNAQISNVKSITRIGDEHVRT